LYDELSECNPINYYGEIKLKIDNFLQSKKDKRVTIVRPITLYGVVSDGGRENPVSMILSRLNKGDNIYLVDDIYVNILFVNDLIKVINKIIEINFYGLINVSGDIVYSRYELGIELSRLMNKNINLIKSVLSQDFNTLAERPKNTSFDNSMMKSFGIIPTSLKESLYLMNII
jgi:dTDP-4-dehydrorhamnose reductase